MTLHLVRDGELARSVDLRCGASRNPKLNQRSVMGRLDGHRESGLAGRGKFDCNLLAGVMPPRTLTLRSIRHPLVRIRDPTRGQVLKPLPADSPALGAQINTAHREQVEGGVRSG
jgi:hypothetical protein